MAIVTIMSFTASAGAAIKSLCMKTITAIVLFLTPLLPLILMLGAAMVADTYAGRKSARILAKRQGKDPDKVVTSRKTKNGLARKMILYIGIMLFAHLASYIFIDDIIAHYWESPVSHPFSVGTMIILLSLEYDSIDEKVKRVDGIGITKRIKNAIRKFKNAIKVGKDVNDLNDQ